MGGNLHDVRSNPAVNEKDYAEARDEGRDMIAEWLAGTANTNATSKMF